MWNLLFVSIIIFTLTWILLEGYIHHVPDKTRFIFWMLAIFLQNAYPMRGKYIRSMLIYWAWFSLVISISFNANFFTVLTTPHYEDRIETLTDAAQKPYIRFGFLAAFEPIVATYSPTLMARVVMNHEDCTLSFKCLNDTIRSKDMIVAKTYSLAKFYMTKFYVDATGKPLIYSLPSPLSYYNINMIMLKGYPVLERFNQLIMRMKMNGLISKWVKEFETAKQTKQGHEHSTALASSFISLDKAWLAFIVWSVGCGASFVVFLKEISPN